MLNLLKLHHNKPCYLQKFLSSEKKNIVIFFCSGIPEITCLSQTHIIFTTNIYILIWFVGGLDLDRSCVLHTRISHIYIHRTVPNTIFLLLVDALPKISCDAHFLAISVQTYFLLWKLPILCVSSFLAFSFASPRELH